MQRYALTYPQLMTELIARGLPEEDTRLLVRAYDAAVGMTRDLFRPSGASFLSHLTRTASITLAHTGDPVMVCAALLHATYSLGGTGGTLARLTRGAPRRSVRRIAGSAVEEIVFAYDVLPWTEDGAPRTHIQRHARYPDFHRRALMLRIANELEDQMDAAVCFRAGGLSEPVRTRARAAADLARALSLPDLGQELDTALDEAETHRVPVHMQTGRRMGYRSSWRHLPEMEGLRRSLRAIAEGRRRRTV